MSGILASFPKGGAYLELLLDITRTASPNIPTLLANAGWKGLRQSVRILNTGNVNTLVIPSSLAGADITIENRSGARIGGVRNGGTALRTQVPIKVDNQGIISGGGGKGLDGNPASDAWGPPEFVPGSVYSAGGAGGNGQGFDSPSGLNQTTNSGGATAETVCALKTTGSGFGGGATTVCVTGTPGYPGGSWGNSGGGYPPQNSNAGYYIDGNDLVTWINTGTRLGRVKA